MISGRLHIHAVAQDYIHHGGDDTMGNKEAIRTQTIVDNETGDRLELPFISGNSIGHMIRYYGALFALQASGLDEGRWSKAQRDLLLSGGTFSKGGSSVKLDAARKLERCFPILAVCGYAAGNYGAESKIDVENWHLACRENRWRLHDRLAKYIDSDDPESDDLAAAFENPYAIYLAADFGTRHEPNSDEAKALLTEGERKRLETEKSEKLKNKHPEKGDSMQMIYEFQALAPRSNFFSCIRFRNLTDLERAALTGALHHACEDQTADGRQIYTIGGRSKAGLGRVAVRWLGSLREDIRPPEHVDSDALVEFGDDDSAMEAYVEHLREHEDEIREAMEALL